MNCIFHYKEFVKNNQGFIIDQEEKSEAKHKKRSQIATTKMWPSTY